MTKADGSKFQPFSPALSLVPSPACDAVLAAEHPSPDSGGPCLTCAFRPGTQANRTEHTMALARACVEGLEPFFCHEQPQVCRGFIAAANLRGAPQDDDDRRWMDANRAVADLLSRAIAHGKAADEEVQP